VLPLRRGHSDQGCLALIIGSHSSSFAAPTRIVQRKEARHLTATTMPIAGKTLLHSEHTHTSSVTNQLISPQIKVLNRHFKNTVRECKQSDVTYHMVRKNHCSASSSCNKSERWHFCFIISYFSRQLYNVTCDVTLFTLSLYIHRVSV
jgi:hypothetical protein